MAYEKLLSYFMTLEITPNCEPKKGKYVVGMNNFVLYLDNKHSSKYK